MGDGWRLVALGVMLVVLLAMTPRSAHESVLRMTMEWCAVCAQVLVAGGGAGVEAVESGWVEGVGSPVYSS